MTNSFNIFSQINNALLDLQGSQLQTFERPLSRLVDLLNDESLKDFNDELTKGLDLDSFIQASEATSGSFVGSAKLLWPKDDKSTLGLTILLIQRIGENSDDAINFSLKFFYSGTRVISSIHALTSQLIIPFVRDYKNYVLNHGNNALVLEKPKSKNIFIVHGHDGEAREATARFISHIGLTPIILHEQASRGRTIIEKVEAQKDVGFVVVLLTPDDEGRSKGNERYESRVRQNVLLELGYFIGLLGRDNVCALKRGDLEIPSDFAGVVWEEMDSNGGWKSVLGRELQAAGYDIDWNKIMRN